MTKHQGWGINRRIDGKIYTYYDGTLDKAKALKWAKGQRAMGNRARVLVHRARWDGGRAHYIVYIRETRR